MNTVIAITISIAGLSVSLIRRTELTLRRLSVVMYLRGVPKNPNNLAIDGPSYQMIN